MNPVYKCNNFPLQIYVEDTDFQGYVYHANYLKFFERARSQALIDIGIYQQSSKQQNKVFLIRNISISYINPAILEDNLEVESLIQFKSDVRIVFHQKLINLKNDNIMCEGKVEVCFFDQIKNKPTKFPQKLLELLK